MGGTGWSPWNGGGEGGPGAVADQMQLAAFDAQANGFLKALLGGLNQRDAGDTDRSLQILLKAIEKDIEGTVERLFGGSVAKHTYADGLSDVDALVILNDSSLRDLSPSEVLRHFAEAIRVRLPRTVVTVGALAVTVTYDDGSEIQLLPAFRSAGGGVQVPDGRGRWSPVVRPDSFARVLTNVNRQQGGRVVPTIKLMKALQAGLPTSQQLSGYHIESLAVEAFRSYSGDGSSRAMLSHLVRFSSDHVLSPIADRTGQSLHVDDYLGPTGSQERTTVSSALSRLSKRLESALKERSLSRFKRLFEDS